MYPKSRKIEALEQELSQPYRNTATTNKISKPQESHVVIRLMQVDKNKRLCANLSFRNDE